MQADAIAREAFCGLAGCPPQAYATLINLVDLYH